MIRAVFFDVSNTLLHKADLFSKIAAVLENNGLIIDDHELRTKHKLLSEFVLFPDKTSIDFYNQFNSQLLYSIGVIPTKELLTKIFNACSYLPWTAFDDTTALANIKLPMGIISNWDDSLSSKLKQHLSVNFDWIYSSQVEGDRKPNASFYELASAKSGINPHEIIYVGDSIKLDIQPAMSIGMKAVLIDRNDFYSSSRLLRIKSLNQIFDHL